MSGRSLLSLWQRFVLGVSANWIAKIGTAITTGSFVALIMAQVFGAMGLINNPYFDLVLFLSLPSLMIVGLVLVALGWFIFARKQRLAGRTIDQLLAERFGEGELIPGAWGTRLLWTVLALTGVNMAVLGGVGTQAKHFMDSREFCGTACHVMDPEWVAYQAGPHAGVDCVDCHVGAGVGALIESKIGGARQFYREATNTYSRPIPAPVHQMRPADETCSRCHQRTTDHGTKMLVDERFAHDDKSTPIFSAVKLHIGGGKTPGIHWHARPDVNVSFESLEGHRERVQWVEVTSGTGELAETERFVRRGMQNAASVSAAGTSFEKHNVREMDCTDCHNRTGHPFQSPEQAMDQAMAAGEIDPAIPRIKDKGYGIITGAIPTSAQGDSTLERVTLALQRYIASTNPHAWVEQKPAIERAGKAMAEAYDRNVHTHMNVMWNSYPDHSGHRGQDQGCFRCHNSEMVSQKTGKAVSHECDTCHQVLADDSPSFSLGPHRNEVTPGSSLHPRAADAAAHQAPRSSAGH